MSQFFDEDETVKERSGGSNERCDRFSSSPRDVRVKPLERYEIPGQIVGRRLIGVRRALGALLAALSLSLFYPIVPGGKSARENHILCVQRSYCSDFYFNPIML